MAKTGEVIHRIIFIHRVHNVGATWPWELPSSPHQRVSLQWLLDESHDHAKGVVFRRRSVVFISVLYVFLSVFWRTSCFPAVIRVIVQQLSFVLSYSSTAVYYYIIISVALLSRRVAPVYCQAGRRDRLQSRTSPLARLTTDPRRLGLGILDNPRKSRTRVLFVAGTRGG